MRHLIARDLIAMLCRVAAVLTVCLVCLPWARAEDVEGTWRLVMRKLPDGTVLMPPTVYGMNTIKNGISHLLVYWPAANGKPASISQISKWEWSENEVAATAMLTIQDDGSGKPVVYETGGARKVAPVTRQGARISYQHPLNAPFVVREHSKSTATVQGVFIDYWERVH